MLVVTKSRHKGLTLIELLVVMAIIGILIGLMLPAVQKLRQAAAQLHNTNNLKQIMLAVHNYTEVNQGYLPNIEGRNSRTMYFEWSFHIALLPYLEQGNAFDLYQKRYPTSMKGNDLVLDIYLNPSDPSLVDSHGWSSYAANAQVFPLKSKWLHVRDGLSNTIGLAEHYAFACGQPKTYFTWLTNDVYGGGMGTRGRIVRRATFADKSANDVLPVTRRNPPVTGASVPGLTFQIAPRVTDSDPRIPQTAFSTMPTAFCDGSVQNLGPGISETIFWALVTPRGGEVIDPDW